MKMSIFVETKISYTKHLEIVTGKKLERKSQEQFLENT